MHTEVDRDLVPADADWETEWDRPEKEQSLHHRKKKNPNGRSRAQHGQPVWASCLRDGLTHPHRRLRFFHGTWHTNREGKEKENWEDSRTERDEQKTDRAAHCAASRSEDSVWNDGAYETNWLATQRTKRKCRAKNDEKTIPAKESNNNDQWKN
jgi:hypothetical protein